MNRNSMFLRNHSNSCPYTVPLRQKKAQGISYAGPLSLLNTEKFGIFEKFFLYNPHTDVTIYSPGGEPGLSCEDTPPRENEPIQYKEDM